MLLLLLSDINWQMDIAPGFRLKSYLSLTKNMYIRLPSSSTITGFVFNCCIVVPTGMEIAQNYTNICLVCLKPVIIYLLNTDYITNTN